MVNPTSLEHRAIAIIPARFNSTRFPGKALALIRGRPLLARVIDRVKKAKKIEHIVVATDDGRIEECARKEGVIVFQTPPDLPSGTDRIRHALSQFERSHGRETKIILNVQGDEPLVEPDLIDRLADDLVTHSQCGIVTASYPLALERLSDPNAVKVVVDQRGHAIYFSRFPIPYSRAIPSEQLICRGHVGIYGYTRSALLQFCDSAASPLEIGEGLEQLRALDIGLKIRVLETSSAAVGVDVPDDVRKIEQFLVERNES